jgi:Raf kinase inhibitor-like YbhB/YbcL family protein
MIPTKAFTGFVMISCTLLVTCGCKPRPEAPQAKAGLSGAVNDEGVTAMSLTIESTAFRNGEPIPTRFTGDGEDLSPHLSWSGVPAGTAELALIMDDPDAPTPVPWVHWVLCRIPADATELPEGVAKTQTLSSLPGAVQGRNSFGNIGYGGPAPPRGHGVHHYHFRLFALDKALSVSPGLTSNQLVSAMKDHILAEAELIGTYQR